MVCLHGGEATIACNARAMAPERSETGQLWERKACGHDRYNGNDTPQSAPRSEPLA